MNLKILGDYHTHTVYSHGKGTVHQNVEAARALGLRQIVVSDHGPGHVAYSLKPRKMSRIYEEVLHERIVGGIDVMLGIEANINGDGSIDLKPKYREYFDLILAGYHIAVWPSTFKDIFGFTFNMVYERLFRPTKAMVQLNTKNLVNAIRFNPIDVLTHVNYAMSVDVVEIAKACADHGTLLELNGKRINIPRDVFDEVLKTDVQFILNSDAHTPDRVGDVSVGLSYIEGYGIEDRIANLDKLPVFRSKR